MELLTREWDLTCLNEELVRRTPVSLAAELSDAIDGFDGESERLLICNGFHPLADDVRISRAAASRCVRDCVPRDEVVGENRRVVGLVTDGGDDEEPDIMSWWGVDRRAIQVSCDEFSGSENINQHSDQTYSPFDAGISSIRAM
jgi:hypothetical protein